MKIKLGGKVLTLASSLGTGATATVYDHPSDITLAIKVYEKSEDCEEARIMYLCDHPIEPLWDGKQPAYAWPLEPTFDPRTDQMNGFVMLKSRNTVTLHAVVNPANRLAEISDSWLAQAAISFLMRLHVAHLEDYILGDINFCNLLVDRHARVTLIDIDPIQFCTAAGIQYLVHLWRPEFQAPELRGEGIAPVLRGEDQDAWSAYTVVHHLLRDGIAPFDFQYVGPSPRPAMEEVIREGIWAESGRHRHFRPTRNGKPLSCLPPLVQELFRQMFDAGHADRSARPTVTDLLTALKNTTSHFH